MSRTDPNLRPRPGFTLVELLVVVAIIGVLIAIALPAVQAARQSADATKCMNNLHQIGLAVLMYCDSNNGYFPKVAHLDPQASWLYQLGPYMEDVDSIRVCPTDLRREGFLKADKAGRKGTSYVLNEMLTKDEQPIDPRCRLTLNKLKATSQTIVVLPTSGRNSVMTDHAHTLNWIDPDDPAFDPVAAWKRVLADIQPDRHWGSDHRRYRKGNAELDPTNLDGKDKSDHTKGVEHYLFADGHVERIPGADLKLRIQNKDNFALPQ